MQSGNELSGTELTEDRGTIFRGTELADGFVNVAGVQHPYGIKDWKSPHPPRVGMVVDVIRNADGQIVSLREVPASVLNQEKAAQALADAKQQGTAVVERIKSRFAVPTLVAALILPVAFFLMPSVGIGSGFGRQTLSGWELAGFDLRTMNPNDHGLLSLLAILCLFSPLAVPFLKQWWARYLYCAPLLFFVVTVLTLFVEIDNAGRSAGRAVGDVFGSGVGRQISSGIADMLHPAVGAFVGLACAIYLATRTFKVR